MNADRLARKARAATVKLLQAVERYTRSAKELEKAYDDFKKAVAASTGANHDRTGNQTARRHGARDEAATGD